MKKQKAPKIVARKKKKVVYVQESDSSSDEAESEPEVRYVKRTGRKPHQNAEYDDEPQAYEQHQPYEQHQQQERPPNRKPNGDMIW